MDLLEDADGMVRDVAKTTVIELFRFVVLVENLVKSLLTREIKGTHPMPPNQT